MPVSGIGMSGDDGCIGLLDGLTSIGSSATGVFGIAVSPVGSARGVDSCPGVVSALLALSVLLVRFSKNFITTHRI
jgi:hypothetical protein